MRHDMAKVVVERPRVGGGKSKPRRDWRGYRQRQNEDDSPRREKIAQKWSPYEKEFSDFLSPLYGFLEKSVGRPWNDVWSDLCHALDRGSVTQRHVLEHVKGFVEFHAYEHNDGRVTDVFERDLGRFSTRTALYVSPSTGLLTRAPRQPKYRSPSLRAPESRQVPLVRFHRINGIWYEVWFQVWPFKTVWRCGGMVFGTAAEAYKLQRELVLKGIPRWRTTVDSCPRLFTSVVDVLRGGLVARDAVSYRWFDPKEREARHWTDGGDVFATKKLQLDSKTIRRYKLREREQSWGGPQAVIERAARGA